MSYLERLTDSSRKSAGSAPVKGSKGASIPFEGDGTGHFRGLPPDIVAGLGLLQSMPAPRITRPEVWAGIVADAVRLGRDGWAAQALGLGWDPLQLWGCSPVPSGNADHDGLTVWLEGRRVLLLDDASCIVEAAPMSHAVFNRRPADGAVYLWDLGARADQMKELAARLSLEIEAERDPAKKRSLKERRRTARFVEKWCRSRNGYV